MIVAGAGLKVVVATRPVDFRKGHDGLVAVVEHELGLDPYCGVVVVFRPKRVDRIKVLWWDGTGVVLASKRLEQGRIAWPSVRDGVMRLSRALFEGLRAQVAALSEHNRHLEQREPEAVVECLRARVASLTEHNRRLEHLLRRLRRAVYGKKSEKLHPDQFQLAFEALEGALAEADEATSASTAPAPRAKRPAVQRNIGHLPEHLARIEEVIEPQSTLCPCGCGEMTKIGEDRTERLDIVPA